jgi:hypothetical protein
MDGSESMRKGLERAQRLGDPGTLSVTVDTDRTQYGKRDTQIVLVVASR